MNIVKPISRNIALQSLSREHHHALLLCFKIKTGFSKGVAPERIKEYADWFYESHLARHFEIEEKYIFPILGSESTLIRQALQEHKLLSKLFKDDSHVEDSLKQIQAELEKHIRFEERILFGAIQMAATKMDLEKIEQIQSERKFNDNLKDEFWK